MRREHINPWEKANVPQPEPRKIIQISAGSDHNRGFIVALCDDGTLWKKDFSSGKWEQVTTYGVSR